MHVSHGSIAPRAAGAFLAMVMTVAGSGPARAFVLAEEGRPACTIVLATGAPAVDRFAAVELARGIARMSGADLPVRTASVLPAAGRLVLVGNGPWLGNPRFANSRDALAALGPDGVIVHAYGEAEPHVLLVAGNGPHGAVYAVDVLLENLGGGWYAPGVESYPVRATVDAGDIRVSDLPCFAVRVCPGGELSAETALRLRCTNRGPADSLGLPAGGRILEFTPADLVPLDEFDTAPDRFPLIKGERLPLPVERCWSAPGTAARAASAVCTFLDASPGTGTVLVRFPGYGTGCTCPACAALRDRTKSESGVVLAWAVRVAAAVGREHPEVVLEIETAGALEKPPEKVEVSPNLLIRLVVPNGDAGIPYHQSFDERALEFTANLHGWAAAGARLVVEHSCGNLAWPAAPFPDIAALADHIEFCHGEFVEGLVFTASEPSRCYAADADFRRWLVAALMWDRYNDYNELRDRWLRAVYGPAWWIMAEYHKHVDALADRDTVTSTADPLDYVTADWLDAADRLFKRAYAATLTDSTAHRAVVHARLGFQWLKLRNDAEMAGNTLDAAARDRLLDFLDRWTADMLAFGYDRASPDEPLDVFAARIRGLLSGAGRSGAGAPGLKKAATVPMETERPVTGPNRAP